MIDGGQDGVALNTDLDAGTICLQSIFIDAIPIETMLALENAGSGMNQPLDGISHDIGFPTLGTAIADINISNASFVGENDEQVESKTYRALTFQATVTGLRDGLLDFFQEMDETQELIETLIVKTATITLQARGTLSITFTVFTNVVE